MCRAEGSKEENFGLETKATSKDLDTSRCELQLFEDSCLVEGDQVTPPSKWVRALRRLVLPGITQADAMPCTLARRMPFRVFCCCHRKEGTDLALNFAIVSNLLGSPRSDSDSKKEEKRGKKSLTSSCPLVLNRTVAVPNRPNVPVHFLEAFCSCLKTSGL